MTYAEFKRMTINEQVFSKLLLIGNKCHFKFKITVKKQ